MTTYRPKGALARAVYDKVHNDQYLEGYDMKLWYEMPKPLHKRFQTKFIAFKEPDIITMDWLDKAKFKSSNLWLQVWHIVARLFLGIFMTQTDVNGLLKRGSMFILSEAQFMELLGAGGFRIDNFGDAFEMLDIGAGDGEVTTRLAQAVFRLGPENMPLRVFTTETSWTMRERLQKQNFTVIDKITDANQVDLIACLNVLDRCADPHQILSDIHSTLSPRGRAVFALVLPYSHYVEMNTSHMPIKPLLPHWPHAQRVPFEEETTAFFEQLEEAGFRVEAWTKAPYLCEGDLRQSFYWLIDIVAVVSKK
uniref:Putative methyltransferase-like protein 9 n=1 Tax=Nyssomyia neivai TaxID=330878 RepID=A0A1L8DCG4_9DIPT